MRAIFFFVCAAAFAAGRPDPSLEWKIVDNARVPAPPHEHPRLYLRARDLPDLNRRVEHPALKPVWEKMQREGGRTPQIGIEVDALRYLLSPDPALGRRTASAALKLMNEAKFDHSIQDITRPIG